MRKEFHSLSYKNFWSTILTSYYNFAMLHLLCAPNFFSEKRCVLHCREGRTTNMGYRSMLCNNEVKNATEMRIATLHYFYSDVRFYIITIGLSVLCIVGIGLNALIVVVFNLKGMRIGVNTFLAGLAVSDAVYVTCLLLNQNLSDFYVYAVSHDHKPLAIQIIRFISYPVMKIAYSNSIWLVLAVSFEVNWLSLRIVTSS